MVKQVSWFLLVVVITLSAGCSSSDSKEPRPPESEEIVKNTARAPILGADTELTTPYPLNDGEQSLASQIFELAVLKMVAETEEGREPQFVSEPTKRGLRVQSNLTGRRYAFELVGDIVQPAKPEWESWLVDGVLITVQFAEEVTGSHDADDTARSLKNVIDRHLEEFREKLHFDIISGSEETLTFPTGELAWYGEVKNAAANDSVEGVQIGKFHLAVTLHNSGSVSMAIPASLHHESEHIMRDLLKRTILSLERLSDLPSDRAPLTVEKLRKTGLTLRQELRMRQFLAGGYWGALVNAELASHRDCTIDGTIALKPSELMFWLNVRLRSQDETSPTSINVFDGQTAHSVNLELYEPETDRYVYWEPWAKGSFLQGENNRAGVQAQQHISHAKNFSVTSRELERILYSVTMEKDEVNAISNFGEAISENPNADLAALRTLREVRELRSYTKSVEDAERELRQRPESMDATRRVCACLDKLGDFLVARGNPDDNEKALQQFARSLSLRELLHKNNKDSPDCAHDVIVSYYKLGEFDVKQEHYDRAITRFQKGIEILKALKTESQNEETTQRDESILVQRIQLCQLRMLTTGEWEAMLRSSPPEALPAILTNRITILAKRGQLVEVARAGAKLRELSARAGSTPNPENPVNTKSITLYNAACAYSLCGMLVTKDKPQPTETEQAERKTYLDLSLTCLKEALAAGYDNFEHMRQDTDLLPLHDLPEFEALFPQPLGK